MICSFEQKQQNTPENEIKNNWVLEIKMSSKICKGDCINNIKKLSKHNIYILTLDLPVLEGPLFSD